MPMDPIVFKAAPLLWMDDPAVRRVNRSVLTDERFQRRVVTCQSTPRPTSSH